MSPLQPSTVEPSNNPTGRHPNITKLYAFSWLKMTLFPMAIITLFWKDQIGLSLTEILLLQGIFSVAMVVMEYPSGYLSDRIGYRTALNLASLLGLAGWGLYTIADSFLSVMAAEIILGASLSFISGSDSALLYETLKMTGETQYYARHEGRLNGFSQGGEAFGALFAGVLYACAPLLPFLLQLIVWLLALLICRSLTEPTRELNPTAQHLAEAWRITRYALLENRHLRYTILLNVLLGLASFYPVWLIQPYMQENGVPLGWFGPIWAGANLSVALFALASHRFHSQLGDQKMILLFVGLIAAGYYGLGLIGGFWGFLFYYLLTCMRGLRGPMLLQHAQEQTPSAHRAAILSLQSLCFRFCFILTGPLVGMLADSDGIRSCFQLLLWMFLLLLLPTTLLFLKNRPQVRPAANS